MRRGGTHFSCRGGAEGPRRLKPRFERTQPLASADAISGSAMHDYNDIPGTTVFDADRSRQGYWLNQFCMSLMKADNREAFKADEAGYLQRFPMTDEQRQAVLDRDWNRMIQ